MALAVDRYELGPIGTNCYVVRTERGAPEAVVVDPGDDAATLRLELAQMGVTVAAILVTHTHYDHIGAVADLAEATGAPVYVSEGEAQVAREPGRLLSRPCGSAPGSPSTTLAGGETIEVAGITFQMVAVPGHSPGHLAYYADGALFSGDVLFAGSVGRTDLPHGDWDDAARVDPRARRPLPARDRRLLRPRPADDARRRARAQPVPGRAACAEVRGAAEAPTTSSRPSSPAGGR